MPFKIALDGEKQRQVLKQLCPPPFPGSPSLLHSRFFYLLQSGVAGGEWGLQSVGNISSLPLLPSPHASPLLQCELSVGCSSCQENWLQPGVSSRICSGTWSTSFLPFSQALVQALQGCFSHICPFRHAEFCPFTEAPLASPMGSAGSCCGPVVEPAGSGAGQPLTSPHRGPCSSPASAAVQTLDPI